MPAKKKLPAIDDLCFEDAMEQLEIIIGRMEGERVPLNSLLKDADKGARLLKHCRGRIEKARARIETINSKLTAEAQNDDAADAALPDPPADHPDDDIQLL